MKKTLMVILLVTAMVFSTNAAIAASYPAKPIQLLIPFGAGGSADIMGRALATAAEKLLGQPVVAINKPGAGGALMYTALHQAAPDGYTLGWNSLSVATTSNIGNVKFKSEDFAYIARVGFDSMVIAVKKEAPWKTFAEFRDYALKNPGVKIGNAGTGSGTHMVAVMMEKAMGIKALHIPLGAERRIVSLMGGEVPAICVPFAEVISQVKAGQARILVVTTPERDPSAPDVPTLKELGYNVSMDLFRGVSAPQGTPAPIIEKLQGVLKKAVEDPAFVNLCKQNGVIISFMGARDFTDYIKVQDKAVAEVMTAAGLKKN
ncbi:MAG: tripartite tricarboxylate transporter substrate binding protein [Thermodesulfobacteriota bacterium]